MFEHGPQVLLVLLLMAQHKQGLVLEHKRVQQLGIVGIVGLANERELEMGLTYDMNIGVMGYDMLHKDVYMHGESSRIVYRQGKIVILMLHHYIHRMHQIPHLLQIPHG